MRALCIAIGILAASSAIAHGAETVGRSNPLRQVLLDTIRPAIEADLGGAPVQFVIDVLQVDGSWAYMAGTAQNADGSPIDFSETHYAEAKEYGFFDGPSVRALLHKSGKRWTLAIFSIGATDVIEAGWPDEFGVPCSVVNVC